MISGEPLTPPEVLEPQDVGADYVVLEWIPIPDPPELFDHYEIHFSTDFNKINNPDYTTLYAEDPEQHNTTHPGENKVMRVEGLNASTTYYFRVGAVDIFNRMSYEPYPREATTKECNEGENRSCGVSNVGICELGDETCIDGKWSGICIGAVYEEDESTYILSCNGLDDDCDGMTDEDDGLQWFNNPEWPNGITPMSRPCNSSPILGECRGGEQYCIDGDWEEQCRDEIGPQPEVCDGFDNDCNGIVDDVNGLTSIESTQCACYDRITFPGELLEKCNGIDDDCDGVIEETQCACYDNTYEVGELEEICNGIDDDCNGDEFGYDFFLSIDDPWQEGGENVDETNYLERPCGFGNCSGGEYECNQYGNGTICSTIGGSQNLAVTEICDGFDNDCDSSIDEGCPCTVGEIYECGFSVGICVPGYQECIQEGGSSYLGECIGGVMPEPEICGDGLDNNCNEIIDDIPWCGCYGGALPSEEVCNGMDDNCDNVIDNIGWADSVEDSKCMCFGGLIKKGEREEVCNDVDDDCNEVIDDPWKYEGEEATVLDYLGLACGYEDSRCFGGKYVCSRDGEYTVCDTMSKDGIGESDDFREEETCNAIDDDCDGTIDDIKGFMSIEETHCGCFDGNLPISEFCNKMDDDCNGKIDEDLLCLCLEGQIKPCGSNIGICTLGHRVCVNGEWGECIGGVRPREENCNRLDDNCDGVVDNVDDGYSVEATRCGCFNNRQPEMEECDGIDNDCNGEIDDDIDCSCEEGETRACGSNVGECSPGQRSCVNGRWGECTGGILPQQEVCDGLDNDCDGIIDNVNGGNSIGSTRCACYNRFAMPGTQSEICNDIDDDCDGKVDEGCAEKEPSHCSNKIKDGDEEGVDCGGSCFTPCFVMPSINTWLLVFAILVAVIAIFGIFFSSFWKKGTKSLFERTK